MVAPLEAAVGLGTTIVGGLLVNELWNRRKNRLDEQSEYEDWYADAVSICEHGLQALRGFENTHQPNYDETRMEMRSTSSQLSRHAGDSAGMDVDEDVVGALRDASEACQSLNNAQTYVGDTSEWDEAFDRAKESLSDARDKAREHL